ncbi:MAG: nucleotidyltransferase [Rhodospirillales bacterium]|nr:nucleotidyltransferase [Rhodospirillales bacterium]MCB9996255.1 nucleotidyltransferase [Rhodospirillales bacterium]
MGVTAQELDEKLEKLCGAYATPVGESEDERCQRAERMIRKAIINHGQFPAGIIEKIDILAQGSFRNGTNISTESDVDVAVCCLEPFFADYSMARGLGALDFGNVYVTYSYLQFKKDVTKALQSAFGNGEVDTTGKKSLKIKPNSGRVAADVVPSFELRQYQADGMYWRGTSFISGDGKVIVNWPRHHTHFAIEKNKATSYRYKKVVRVLKSFRGHLTGQLADTPSFLIESMVWNVDNALFGQDTLLQDCKSVLDWLVIRLSDWQYAQTMKEANMIKWLFTNEQPWKLADALAFVLAVRKELRM